MELFGVKFLALVSFCAVALAGPSSFTAISILVFLYGFMVTLFVFMSVLGNRVRTVSVVYLWTLIMGFSFLFGLIMLFPRLSGFREFPEKPTECTVLPRKQKDYFEKVLDIGVFDRLRIERRHQRLRIIRDGLHGLGVQRAAVRRHRHFCAPARGRHII